MYVCTHTYIHTHAHTSGSQRPPWAVGADAVTWQDKKPTQAHLDSRKSFNLNSMTPFMAYYMATQVCDYNDCLCMDICECICMYTCMHIHGQSGMQL